MNLAEKRALMMEIVARGQQSSKTLRMIANENKIDTSQLPINLEMQFNEEILLISD